MKHEIDLKNYNFRTDLAIESVKNYEIEEKPIINNHDDIKVTEIKLNKEEGKMIGKKPGLYTTLEFVDITDYDNREKIKHVFSKYLKKMINDIGIKKNDTGLIIGLGNSNSTPDALGPLSISHVMVTRHLSEVGELERGYRVISKINTSVMGETGIETLSIITGIVNELKPNFIITIDALKSSSIERVNKTIQLTDTGIHPGSGVGNKRKEVSKETLNIPVIAIGVPTVVDLVTVVSDTVTFTLKHFSYMKENMKKASFKLQVPYHNNYLNKKINVNEEDSKNLLGMIGVLNEDEKKELFSEVLNPIGYNMIVTPKEIDFIIEKLSEVIGEGINSALHENIN